MTAPVPPDANGLREAACEVMHDAYEAAAQVEGWETQERSRKPWSEVPEANKATMRAAVGALLDFLAASEAAPTAGEHRPNACCDFHRHIADGCCHCGDDIPATPPADDASEGLSGGDRELICRAVAETPCGPLHAEFGWTPGEACSKCEDRADELMPFLARQVEGIKSAGATRARVEGAAEALREAAANAWCDIDRRRLLAMAARSDAAPHAGGQS